MLDRHLSINEVPESVYMHVGQISSHVPTGNLLTVDAPLSLVPPPLPREEDIDPQASKDNGKRCSVTYGLPLSDGLV